MKELTTVSTMRSTELKFIVNKATGKYAELANFHKHVQKVLINQLDSIMESAKLLPNSHVKNHAAVNAVQILVNESGLYSSILGSKKPEAKIL